MDKFLSSIKLKYKDKLINREKQWPLCHSNKLVRLELVEREKGQGYCDNIQRGSDDQTVKRTPFAYGDLFKVESGQKPVRKVLVEGDAGIGKTTLSVSISEDWSCEKLFQEFELVLLLPLRHKKVASAGSLPELLKLLHPSADVCKSVARYLEEEEAKVLVIADGWDELSESERQEESFLYELLFETFPLMSVVVTSRPSASAPLHRLSCIDRFVEIKGFGKEDIKEYIHCVFSSEHDKACRLLEQLEDNPLVESVCSVPLNCAIVCHLWRTSEEALPSTMTQLYTKIVLNVILRNIRKKYSFKNVLSLPNFDALPKELQQSFRLLCEFAFKALKKNQIVFSQEELVEFFPEGLALDENILCLGLLQSAETVLETGHGVSFHFLHLTIMEYLAALHFSGQPHSNLLEMFDPMLNDPSSSFGASRSDIVWRFFYGLFFLGSGKESKEIGIRIFKRFAERYTSSRLDLCHCAFESQNDSIVHETIQHVQKHPHPLQFAPVRNFGDLRTAHDFAAVLYVMTNMNVYSGMVLDLSRCGLRENQIRRFTDILASKQGKLRVTELCLDGNKLTGECVSDLFHRASAAFKPDEHFCSGDMNLDSHTSTPSTRNGLMLLNLSYNFLGASELESLQNVVRYRFFANLRYLNLEGCLNGDAHTNATVTPATFIEALSTNCPLMEELNLSSNNLGVPGASAVATCVSSFQKYLQDSVPDYRGGFKLHLDGNNIGDDGLKVFVDNLDGVYNFRNLSLSDNSIHAAGVSYLVESVCSGRLVMSKKNPFYELCLDDNQLGQKGTIEICKMLICSRCKFAIIHLRRCTLCRLTTAEYDSSNTDSVSLSNSVSCESIGRQLCQMPQKHSVRILCLDGNNFSGDGIHILIGIMHLCVNLVELNCSDCGITSDDFILFLNKITKLKSLSPDLCSQLESWDLSKNKIDDSGVMALINHLPALYGNPSSLKNVPSLDDNSVSNAVEMRLAKEVSSLFKEVS